MVLRGRALPAGVVCSGRRAQHRPSPRRRGRLADPSFAKIIELEDNLRKEYQDKLDAATAEAERSKQELAEQREQMQATIDQQLATIQELSGKTTANEQLEQRNRELGNRSENLQEEVASQKKAPCSTPSRARPRARATA